MRSVTRAAVRRPSSTWTRGQIKPAIADAGALGDHLDAIGDSVGAMRHMHSTSKVSTRILACSSLRLPWPKVASPPGTSAARSPQRIPDGRRRDPHARRSRGAARGRYEDARTCSRVRLELAPGFHAARHNYALVLHRDNKPRRRSRRSKRCCAHEPAQPGYRNLKAAVLAASASTARRSRIYADCCASIRARPKVWMSYGHALKTAGRQDGLRSPPIAAASSWNPASARRSGAWRTSRPSASAPTTSPMRRSWSASIVRRGPLALRLRARQGARGRTGTTGFVRALRARQSRCARRACSTTPTTRRTCADQARCSRRSSSRARGSGPRRARSDLHRRPAALGLDAARADPVEPLRRRRHDGTAGHPRSSSSWPTHDGDALAAYPDALPRSTARGCARSASGTSSRRASIARPARRSSSTRCRTTSRTSA